MPIYRLLKEASFSPEEVVTISAAFEGACKTLGLIERQDPIVEMVAKAILRAAEHGADSAEQIQQRALLNLQSYSRRRSNQRLVQLFRAAAETPERLQESQ
jgi:hypothetical protein